jgi:hypothetical protein
LHILTAENDSDLVSIGMRVMPPQALCGSKVNIGSVSEPLGRVQKYRDIEEPLSIHCIVYCWIITSSTDPKKRVSGAVNLFVVHHVIRHRLGPGVEKWAGKRVARGYSWRHLTPVPCVALWKTERRRVRPRKLPPV